MKKIIRFLRVFLTILLIPGAFFAFLAGTDIFHGIEPDLTLEWTIFSSFFYLCCFFFLVNLADLIIGAREEPLVR
ncbi:MAG: hypothetical protein V2I46_10290 [Bacteroides sp.]|jgi:hypothetical protein|nr:hypothetical protein [Bacteroides sp.]